MENEPDNNEEIETINTSSSINDNSGAESISSGQALKERVLKLVKKEDWWVIIHKRCHFKNYERLKRTFCIVKSIFCSNFMCF